MDIELPDATLHYTTLGSGPQMLVMHGGMGLDHTYLRPWLDPLAEDFRLVYYDHRGNGRSTHRGGLDDVDHDTWVSDADALRKAVASGPNGGVDDPVILLGHSYGAFLALEYAIRHGRHLHGLILVGATPALDYVPEALTRARQRATDEQMEALTRFLSEPVPDDQTFRERWQCVLPVYFHRFEDAFGVEMDRDARYSAAAYNQANGRCLPGYDVRHELCDIGVPTLVLSGRHDWITPPDLAARRLEDSIPDVRNVVFDRSGHFPFVEETESFLHTIRDWVAEIRSPLPVS